MLVYCERCGAKQSLSNVSCAFCFLRLDAYSKIDPFFAGGERSMTAVSVGSDGLVIAEFEIAHGLFFRIYYRITNPWRRRWRYGPVWKVTLLTFLAVFFYGIGFGGNWYWTNVRCDVSSDPVCGLKAIAVVQPVAARFAEQMGMTEAGMDLVHIARIHDVIIAIVLANHPTLSGGIPRGVGEILSGTGAVCHSLPDCIAIGGISSFRFEGVAGNLSLNQVGSRQQIMWKRVGRSIDAKRVFSQSYFEQFGFYDSRSLAQTQLEKTTSVDLVTSGIDEVLLQRAIDFTKREVEAAGLNVDVHLYSFLGEHGTVTNSSYVILAQRDVSQRNIDLLLGMGKDVIVSSSMFTDIGLNVTSNNALTQLSYNNSSLVQLVSESIDPERPMLLVTSCRPEQYVLYSRLFSARAKLSGSRTSARCFSESSLDARFVSEVNHFKGSVVFMPDDNLGQLMSELHRAGLKNKQNFYVVLETPVLVK